MTPRTAATEPGSVPPTRVAPVSQGGSTFAERRAERLEREARDGVPARRRLALDAGPGPADTNFVILNSSDSDGSAT